MVRCAGARGEGSCNTADEATDAAIAKWRAAVLDRGESREVTEAGMDPVLEDMELQTA